MTRSVLHGTVITQARRGVWPASCWRRPPDLDTVTENNTGEEWQEIHGHTTLHNTRVSGRAVLCDPSCLKSTCSPSSQCTVTTPAVKPTNEGNSKEIRSCSERSGLLGELYLHIPERSPVWALVPAASYNSPYYFYVPVPCAWKYNSWEHHCHLRWQYSRPPCSWALCPEGNRAPSATSKPQDHWAHPADSWLRSTV